MELKGQKGKQGLRLARPEAKLGQIHASFPILSFYLLGHAACFTILISVSSFGGSKTSTIATQDKV